MARIKCGARVRVITSPNSAVWGTADREITFTLPAGADDADVRIAAADRAAKRWRNCWVVDTWRA